MTLATSCQVASFQIFSFRLRPKTDRGSSGANRGRKGGRERADDALLFHRNKRTPEQSELCSDVARGFNLDISFSNPNSNPNRNPAERIRFGSEEKARPAYEKALRPFHRLRAFSELSGGFNPDILPWNPCTATACKFPAKNTRNFFEVLLTLFEPPAEFNADITRPAFGTHPAAILASVLLLSADR